MSTLTPNMERRVTLKTLAGAPAPGFAGPGHTAVEVVAPTALADTDPFVILADDTLDFRPGQPVGEAHPHPGLETVTLMLEGSLNDKEEGLLEEGDLAWMTAGRGLVHNEDVKATGRARVLQLWVALASRDRDLGPRLADTSTVMPSCSARDGRRSTGLQRPQWRRRFNNAKPRPDDRRGLSIGALRDGDTGASGQFPSVRLPDERRGANRRHAAHGRGDCLA